MSSIIRIKGCYDILHNAVSDVETAWRRSAEAQPRTMPHITNAENNRTRSTAALENDSLPDRWISACASARDGAACSAAAAPAATRLCARRLFFTCRPERPRYRWHTQLHCTMMCYFRLTNVSCFCSRVVPQAVHDLVLQTFTICRTAGSGRGIGFHTARLLALMGAVVYITDLTAAGVADAVTGCGTLGAR